MIETSNVDITSQLLTAPTTTNHWKWQQNIRRNLRSLSFLSIMLGHIRMMALHVHQPDGHANVLNFPTRIVRTIRIFLQTIRCSLHNMLCIRRSNICSSKSRNRICVGRQIFNYITNICYVKMLMKNKSWQNKTQKLLDIGTYAHLIRNCRISAIPWIYDAKLMFFLLNLWTQIEFYKQHFQITN